MGSSERLGTSTKLSSTSSQAPPKQYGVTKPISMAGPKVDDLQRTMELEKVSFIAFSLYRHAPFRLFPPNDY